MDNNPADSSHKGEEEYQFTEEDTAHKYEAPASTMSSSTVTRDNKKTSLKKPLLIIVGVIIGVFCLYKLYGLFTAAPSKTAMTTAKQATPSKPLPAPALAQTPSLTEDRENLKNQISVLERNMTQDNQTHEDLQTQIGGLSAAIADIQNNVALLTQQMNTFAQQKKEADLKAKTPEKAKTKTARSATLRSVKRKISYFPPVTYYLKALIQGRAWLVNVSGATFTVSTGDPLPGYGRILDIHPDKGVVMTSSGRVISFMPQDR